MRFQPLGNRLLVKLIEEKTSNFGIIIPDTVTDNDRLLTGEVVAFGDVKGRVGTKVVFARYAADEIDIEGVKHYIVSASGILGEII